MTQTPMDAYVYAGLCPDVTQPDSRDEDCPACRLLTARPAAPVSVSDERILQVLAQHGAIYCGGKLSMASDGELIAGVRALLAEVQQGQGERPAGTGGVPVELDRCDSLILADGYRGGSCIADGDSNTVMLHYRTSEQAEAAFDVITTAIDAGNAGVSASDGQTKPLSAADTSTNKESHSGTTRKSLD